MSQRGLTPSKPVALLFLGALAFFILLSASGCATYRLSSIDSQSESFHLTSGIVKFSFDFSPRYKLAEVSLNDSHSEVVLESSSPADPLQRIQIAVWVAELTPGETSYQNKLDSELASLKPRDFVLLSNSTRSLDGEPAGQVAYNYSREQSVGGDSLATLPAIVRWLMFAREGFLWWIRVDAPAAQTGTALGDYNRVIQTFRTLDRTVR